MDILGTNEILDHLDKYLNTNFTAVRIMAIQSFSNNYLIYLSHFISGKINNNDENYRQIAEGIFKHRGYVPEHALSKNW